MRRHSLCRFSVLLVTLVLLAPAAARAQAFVIPAVRVTAPPTMNGSIGPQWHSAPKVTIGWNVDFHRPASNLTEASVLFDDRNLYVLFVVHQREPVAATQKSDGSGVDNDDHIGLYLWPSGPNGFRYFFEANPLGARYQESSENQDFTPPWSAVGHRTADGYDVTVRIPLSALRGGGLSTWRLQLDRYVTATQEQNVWAHVPAQRDEGQAIYAGDLTGMGFAASLTRAKPRIGVYGLARAASQAGGGSAARSGLDAAIPVTARTSFVGTFHPDFSNVELDQQTITPTEFKRIFQEVRPFFVQGASFYNHFTTVDNDSTTLLYTPSIPTPREGYALEGYQGNFGFGAFDAVGVSRNDNAQSVSWTNDAQTISASAQRVGVAYPGFSDTATGVSATYDNQRTGYVYADYAQDRGTAVLDPAHAKWTELGAAYRVPETRLGLALRSIGAYFQPADGYTPHPDIAGYLATGHHFFSFSKESPLLALSVDGNYGRYHDYLGRFDQGDAGLSLSATSRNLISATISTGSHQLLLADGSLDFFNQNGLTIGYLDGTSTPTDMTFEGGRFGAGYLRTLLLSTALPLPNHQVFGLEADKTVFRSDSGALLTQWLQRASLSWQINRDSSFTLGLRRLIGTAPPYPTPSPAVYATNLSAAYHRLLPHSEIYLVYGDPNTISTTRALILKYIFYIGSTKGT